MTRSGDLLYVAADPKEGHVYAFRFDAGALVWKWPSGSGVSSDLLAVDGWLLAVTLDNELVALDAFTGSERWRVGGCPGNPGAPITPSPVALDGDIVWGRVDGTVARHDLASGDLRWEVTLPAGVSTDLIRHQDSLFMGLADGRLLRLDPADGRVLVEAELGLLPTYRWLPVGTDLVVGMTGVTGPERRLVSVDAHTLATRWALAAPAGFQWTNAQPALGWDLVLAGTTEPALYAVDPATGEISWRAEVAEGPRTMKVVGDTVFIGTFEGSLFAYSR